MTSIRKILVPYDFSTHSAAALGVADELAIQLNAEMHLLHVLRPAAYAYSSEIQMGFAPTRSEKSSPDFEYCLNELKRAAAVCTTPQGRLSVDVVVGSSVSHLIASESDRLGSDLIVMGTHGRTGLSHLLLGSVAEATIRTASSLVLTVPNERHALPESTRWESVRHPAEGSI